MSIDFARGFFWGIASVFAAYYLTKMLFAVWLGPMLDKHDRGHQ